MEMSQIRIVENGQINFTFTQPVTTCKRIKITVNTVYFSVPTVEYKRSPQYIQVANYKASLN